MRTNIVGSDSHTMRYASVFRAISLNTVSWRHSTLDARQSGAEIMQQPCALDKGRNRQSSVANIFNSYLKVKLSVRGGYIILLPKFVPLV